MEYRTDFPIRGLLIDRKLGNVLKMDRYKYVKRAYHGTRDLPLEERRSHYHAKKIQPGTERYHWVEHADPLPIALQTIDFYANVSDPRAATLLVLPLLAATAVASFACGLLGLIASLVGGLSTGELSGELRGH